MRLPYTKDGRRHIYKAFTSKESWDHAIRLLGFRHGDFLKVINAHASAVTIPISRTDSPAPNLPLCSIVPNPRIPPLPLRDVHIPPHNV